MAVRPPHALPREREPYRGKPLDAKGWKPRPKWQVSAKRMVDGQVIRLRYLYPTLSQARAAAKKLIQKPDIDGVWISEVDPFAPKK